MFDVAIVGAGPAGATLARLIGKSHRVLLIDKRPFKEPSEGFACEKCCGGLLAPDAQRMLSKLGLGLPRSVLEDPQLFVVKAVDIPQRLERYYQRHYINMNRQRFDRWLLSLVPAGVDIRTGCRLDSYALQGASCKLALLHDGMKYTEEARVLVGADGAASRVRRGLGSRCMPARRYFAVQEWVERDHSQPYFTSLFDREITDYYCWTIPKADHLIIGAALYPRRHTCEKFDLLKKKLRGCGFAFGKTVRREGGFLLRPLGAGQVCTGRQRVALVGEAAGWISPSSAEGLSYAFRSALLLAEALHGTPGGLAKRYREKTRSLKRNIFQKNLKSQVIFNPALRRAIMQSGLQSVRMYVPPETVSRV